MNNNKIWDRQNKAWLVIVRKLKGDYRRVQDLANHKTFDVNIKEQLKEVVEGGNSNRFVSQEEYNLRLNTFLTNKDNYKQYCRDKDYNTEIVKKCYLDELPFILERVKLLGDKEFVIMQEVGRVKLMNNPELVSITYKPAWEMFYNWLCDQEGQPHLKNSVGISQEMTWLAMLLDVCKYEHDGKTARYGKILLTRQGTPLYQVEVVEKVKEVQKRVEVKVKSETTDSKDKVLKIIDKLAKKKARELNDFQAKCVIDTLEELKSELCK